MYVLDTPLRGRVAWVLPPKTGTRTIEHLLRYEIKATPFGGRHGAPAEELDKCDLIVANVRNPYDILRSWYDYHPSGRAKSFDEWLRIQCGSGDGVINYLETTTLIHARRATEFCRYEKGMSEEVNRIMFDLGYRNAPIEIGHVGKAENAKPWQERFTPELRELALQKYGADFDDFGYER